MRLPRFLRRDRAPDLREFFPEVRSAVRQHQRDKIDQTMALLARHRSPPWQERAFYLELLGDDAPLAALDERCRSDSANPDAWLLRGRRRTHWAWEARGSGHAHTVTRVGWRKMAQRLEKAESDLLWSAKLLPEDPTPHFCLISVGMGLSHTADQIRSRLAEALERDPESYHAYDAATYALTEKWCGSHDQMFEVAREAAARATPENDLMVVMFRAHFERWSYFRHFDDDPEGAEAYLRDLGVQREVAFLFDRTLADPGYRMRPSSYAIWNQAAFWFWLTEDRRRLTTCLERIGKGFHSKPWNVGGQAAEAIADARAMARGD